MPAKSKTPTVLVAAACMMHFHHRCKGKYPNEDGKEPCMCRCHDCCNPNKMQLHTKTCPRG